MPTSRRSLIKAGLAAATAAALLGAGLGVASTPTRPLRILILGGTGFTGPTRCATRCRVAIR